MSTKKGLRLILSAFALVLVVAVLSTAVILAATGIVLGAVYMLSLVERVFWNELRHDENRNLADMSAREVLAFAPLAVFMVWIGVSPGTFLGLSEAAIRALVGG
jgi:NADH-quinone oxidoreductase subunit M